jgi:hypothetical protein
LRHCSEESGKLKARGGDREEHGSKTLKEMKSVILWLRSKHKLTLKKVWSSKSVEQRLEFGVRKRQSCPRIVVLSGDVGDERS